VPTCSTVNWPNPADALAGRGRAATPA